MPQSPELYFVQGVTRQAIPPASVGLTRGGTWDKRRVSDDLCDWLVYSSTNSESKFLVKFACGVVDARRMQVTAVNEPMIQAVGSAALLEGGRVEMQRGMSRSALGCEALMSYPPFLVVRRTGNLPLQKIDAT